MRAEVNEGDNSPDDLVILFAERVGRLAIPVGGSQQTQQTQLDRSAKSRRNSGSFSVCISFGIATPVIDQQIFEVLMESWEPA